MNTTRGRYKLTTDPAQLGDGMVLELIPDQARASPDPTPTPPEPEPTPDPLDQTSPEFREHFWHLFHVGRWQCAPEAPNGTVGVDGRRKYYGGDMRGLASLGDMTGDPHLHELATAHTREYAEHLTNGGNVTGRWVFPHNLARCAVETGDTIYADALGRLATASPFGTHAANLDRLKAEFRPTRVRDYAYLASTYAAIRSITPLVVPVPNNVPPLVPVWETCIRLLIDQITAWTGDHPTGFCQPFMFALACEALWEYGQLINGPDTLLRSACQAAIVDAANWIETHAWRESNQSWQYWIDLPHDPATDTTHGPPDLNALIAFIPAAAYKITGDETHAARYDTAIASARQRAYVVNKWIPGPGAKMWAQGVRLLRQAAELRFDVDLDASNAAWTNTVAPAATFDARHGTAYRTELDYTTNVPCSVVDVRFEAAGGEGGSRPPLSIRTRKHRIWFPNFTNHTFELTVTFRDLAGSETTHTQQIASRP